MSDINVEQQVEWFRDSVCSIHWNEHNKRCADAVFDTLYSPYVLAALLKAAREELLCHTRNDAGSRNTEVISLIKDIDAALRKQP
jgi:hypothetical protein